MCVHTFLCEIIAGVGLNFDEEIQKQHKQCHTLAIDPDERSRSLVMMNNPKNQFVQVAASDMEGSNIALMKQGLLT